MFFKTAHLFTGFIHFATGLTEGPFFYDAVWKSWNITASEVQFLGDTAAVKVELLEASEALDAARRSAGADLVSCCSSGTEGPSRAGFEPSRSGCSTWTSSTCTVTG